MKFNRLIDDALVRAITPDEALFFFQQSEDLANTIDLFRVASQVRDRSVGKCFKLDGAIASVTKCEVSPPCLYCWRGANPKDTFEDVLTLQEVEIGARAIADTGASTIGLIGGTPAGSALAQIVDVIKVIQQIKNFHIWVNIGPALEKEDLIKLKELGVAQVGCSFETLNKQIFRKVKPGDSLDKRIEFAKMVNDVGLGLRTVLMVGLGESYEDIVSYIFFVKQFRTLRALSISWLQKYPGIKLAHLPPISPVDAARTCAIARLVLRDLDIYVGLWQYIQLWAMAGANSMNNAGVAIQRPRGHVGGVPPDVVVRLIVPDLELINFLPITTKYLEAIGFHYSF